MEIPALEWETEDEDRRREDLESERVVLRRGDRRRGEDDGVDAREDVHTKITVHEVGLDQDRLLLHPCVGVEGQGVVDREARAFREECQMGISCVALDLYESALGLFEVDDILVEDPKVRVLVGLLEYARGEEDGGHLEGQDVDVAEASQGNVDGDEIVDALAFLVIVGADGKENFLGLLDVFHGGLEEFGFDANEMRRVGLPECDLALDVQIEGDVSLHVRAANRDAVRKKMDTDVSDDVFDGEDGTHLV